jgi:hypothetical protein
MIKRIRSVFFIQLGILLLSFSHVHAQFFKDILNTVKQTAQGRANDKAAQTTNTVINKAENPGQPKPTNTANSGSTPPNTAASNNPSPIGIGASNSGPAPNTPGDQDSDSSFLTLNLSSDRIVAGTGITISGNSIKFGSMKDVAITVNGNDANISNTLPLTDSGFYKTVQIFSDAGDYTITVLSSNRKSRKTVILKVFTLTDIDSVTKKNKDELVKAYDMLKNWVASVKSLLAPTDAEELQGKFDELTDKKDMTLKVFNDLGNMGKSMDKLQKEQGGLGGGSSGGGNGNGNSGGGGSQSGNISPQLSSDLTKLTDGLSDQAKQMETLNTAATHKPYDNTICEYMQMVSEACAAFSTFTNFFNPSGILKSSVTAIGKDLMLDKGVTMAAGAVSSAAGVNDIRSSILQETSKYCTTVLVDIDAMKEKITKAGFAGDIVSMCTDYFMHKYCGTMAGEMTEDYKCTFTNSNKTVWWEYTYHNEATVKLRYLKSAATSTLIKMKGNIEGNATKFTIYQKVSEMDAFKDAMKNRANIFSICLYVPPTMPVATSNADKNTNFGAVARAIVTPAYFNIPIDVDYDPETGKFKIYCNEAIMDYGPQVQYVYGYICIAAMIPLTTRVNFPINKAKLTIAKVIEKNNDFTMKTGADHQMSFTKTAGFDLGAGEAIEHNIKMTISAKSN